MCRPPGRGRPGLHGSRFRLRALFFEDEFGFFGGLLFFAIGAGDIAEGRGHGDGTELPERALALSVGVASAADERALGGHGVRLGMQRMAGRLNYLRLV